MIPQPLGDASSAHVPRFVTAAGRSHVSSRPDNPLIQVSRVCYVTETSGCANLTRKYTPARRRRAPRSATPCGGG